jgi:hypothetical protein
MSVVVKIGPDIFSWIEYTASSLEGITITTGRQDARSPVNPTTCSVTLLYDSALGSFDPSTFSVGDLLIVEKTAIVPIVRFTGRVTDLQFDEYVLTITAVTDGISRFGRFSADFTIGSGYTGEILDDTYTSVLVNAYPGTAPTANFDPGITYLDTPTLTNSSPAQFVQTVSASEPNSFFYELPDGSLEFRDQEHFRYQTPDVTFLDTEVLEGWQVTKRISDKINSSLVNYVGGSETYTETSDVTIYGLIQQSLDTYCSDPADALNLATRTVKNYALPGWTLPGITVAMSPLSSARQAFIANNSGIAQLVEIPSLAPGLNTYYVVQGYSETFGRYSWDINFYLSDWTLFRPSQNWEDIISGITWVAVPGSITWDDMLRDWI